MSKKTIEKKESKKCFIITPIGAEGSDIRTEITGVIESVIKPTLESEYIVKAAHLSLSSVQITKEIIEDIFNADLIIANLTGANPNVMYELSFAHALRKPVVHIIKEGENPPFDINEQRYIKYTDNMIGVKELNEKLTDYVDQAITDSKDKRVSNPITDAIDSISIQSENYEASVTETLDLMLRRLNSIENYQQENTSFMNKSNYKKEFNEKGRKVRTRTLIFQVEADVTQMRKIHDYIANYPKIDIHTSDSTVMDEKGTREVELRYSYSGLYDNDFFVDDLKDYVGDIGVNFFKQLI